MHLDQSIHHNSAHAPVDVRLVLHVRRTNGVASLCSTAVLVEIVSKWQNKLWIVCVLVYLIGKIIHQS